MKPHPLLAAAALAALVLPATAQTLPYPMAPCHVLGLADPLDRPCFDDRDRNGRFEYHRGDRAYTFNSWIRYQLASGQARLVWRNHVPYYEGCPVIAMTALIGPDGVGRQQIIVCVEN